MLGSAASTVATPTATRADEANSAEVADVAPTDRCRDVPNNAYTSSEATSVYRPACGGRPAIPA